MRIILSDFVKFLKSTQNWFIKAEKSSGFRPYLIFLILLWSFGLIILRIVSGNTILLLFCIGFIYVLPIIHFSFMYTFMAIKNPDFCRSERLPPKGKLLSITESHSSKFYGKP